MRLDGLGQTFVIRKDGHKTHFPCTGATIFCCAS